MLPLKLPFYYKTHEERGNGEFPEILPFDVYFSDALYMYRQRVTSELKDILHKVYQLGSLVDGSISNESGLVYVDAITGFIKNQVMDTPEFSILEIGCGNGVILRSLKKKINAAFVGLEPGNHKAIPGIEDIRIIRDFFPSKQLTQKFDLVYSLLVLEHIEDPVEFLKAQSAYLNINGKLIFAVPNCEPFLEAGDISIFIHEHVSYFTRESIYYTVKLAGLSVENITEIEGLLVAVVTPSVLSVPDLYHINRTKFESSIALLNNKIMDLFKNYAENEIAVYVPGRALNTLFQANKINCRLVDDNSEITGKYLPGLNNPVENFESLICNPTKLVLIFSRTFGERIKTKCMTERSLVHTKVLTLNDLDQ